MVVMTCLGSATSLSVWLQQLPQQEQPPLHRVSWCPLHPVHDCLLIQESHLVGNRDGQQGKEAEVLQQLSCTARAWRKPPRDFPREKGLS